MLPKKNRADKKTVEAVFKEGKFINSPDFTFKFINTNTGSKKISIIVPKSVSKLAVKRNLLRRLGYSVLEKKLMDFPLGIQGVFVFKKYQDNILIIENEIKSISDKIH
ncbi:MAG: ribonuclease P protein component [Minisyncoccia bacterium]